MHENLFQHKNTFSIHFYINSFIFRPNCQTTETKVVCPTMQLNTPIKKTNDTNYHDKLHRCSQLVLVNSQCFTPWLTTLTLCSVRPRGAYKFGTFQNSGINNFDNSGEMKREATITWWEKTVRNTNEGFKPQSVGHDILHKIGWWQTEKTVLLRSCGF